MGLAVRSAIPWLGLREERGVSWRRAMEQLLLQFAKATRPVWTGGSTTGRIVGFATRMEQKR